MSATGTGRGEAQPPREAGLVLIGYRGVGKTTIGRAVARLTSRPFVDLDHEIERALQRPIAAYFAEAGEAAFREVEQQALAQVIAAQPGAVLATGGGVILRPENRRALATHGLVIWLEAPAELLSARLEADPAGRPALTERGLTAEVAEVLERRHALYREAADRVLPVALRTVDELAAEIVEQWDAWPGRGRACQGWMETQG